MPDRKGPRKRLPVPSEWKADNAPSTPRVGNGYGDLPDCPKEVIEVMLVSSFTTVTAVFTATPLMRLLINADTSSPMFKPVRAYTSSHLKAGHCPDETLPFIVAMWLVRRAGEDWVYEYLQKECCEGASYFPWATAPLASPFSFDTECERALLDIDFGSYGHVRSVDIPKECNVIATRMVVNFPDNTDTDERFYGAYEARERSQSEDGAYVPDHICFDSSFEEPRQ